ncbi:Sds3-like-domain-containing protein [Bisporella sp. PMI_857]|nr:Sds3-like-domain-containing protein [Bisporella sp. PMI_857]
MSVNIELAGADAILEAARQASAGELSDVDMDGDEDRSSSLSEIEYKDSHQDEEGELSDDLNNESDEDNDIENDSEAETERLEESPNKVRTHKDVVLSSHNDSDVFERSPSKLQTQLIPVSQNDEEEDDDDPLSDEETPLDSPKSSVHDEVGPELTTAPTTAETSTIEAKGTLSINDVDTRKRKRSIMAGSGLDHDADEPSRKRMGSVIAPGDEYAIGDEERADEEAEGDISNPISGNITGDEGGEVQEDNPAEAVTVPIVIEEQADEQFDEPISPKKRGRKKKKVAENGVSHDEDPDSILDVEATLNGDHGKNGEGQNAQNEADDEAEAALRNEEELERKRIALDQLGLIEKQFATFRERLYEERLEQLNREEAMLREDKPTHPEYLAMMQPINARRDEKVKQSENLRKYELETLRRYAVARRSQILIQYQQEVREIREKKLEQLGKQWYEIQHDRRSYAGSVPDYTLKFPTRRSQQVANQVAYANEVSILSGVAKYVGFPAAPKMSKATDAELLEDLEKMGRSRQPQPIPHPAAGLQELAALRTAGSTSRFKPAEEQFIEQTPWANPQHPSHAHLLQRQTSAQHAPRTSSPFAQTQTQPRRHSHQQALGAGPVSGTFSSSSIHQTNGHSIPTGRVSPHNPFSSSAHPHPIAPSPLGSRQPSLSPQQNRQPPSLTNQQLQHTSASLLNGLKATEAQGANTAPGDPRETPTGPDIRREQISMLYGRL